MRPHLVRWAKEYGEKGFVLVEVDNGQIDTKPKLDEHVRADEVPYRTIWDEGAKLCTAYGVRGFPSAYLLDTEGKVIWEGHPHSSTEAIEALIKEKTATVADDKKADPDAAAEDGEPKDEEGGE